MRQFISRSGRRLFSIIAQKLAGKYIQKERSYSYQGLSLKVYKDVFHPGLFRSTKIFAGWLQEQSIKDRKLLELGCGTGLLSLVAARAGAEVTAVDINPVAVENAKANAIRNNITIVAAHSDLFSALSMERFDIVLINPPYYPQDPRTVYEHAWYCGAQFDYFEKLFSQLLTRDAGESYYMILSDTCEMDTINRIASKHSLLLREAYTKKNSGELFVIYKVTHHAVS